MHICYFLLFFCVQMNAMPPCKISKKRFQQSIPRLFQADTECVERDAQLTSVHSQEEHEFIASTANKRRLWVGFHKTQTRKFWSL